MTTYAYGIAGFVREELVEMLSAFQAHAGCYAARYLEHVTDGAPRPQTPASLHPKVAAAIRDVVLDQASVAGLVPARYR